MPKSKGSDYEVGYGRPPKHSRFVKGRSGNPSGRPKGAKSVATRINEVLNQKVRVNTEKGPLYMTKLQAALMQLANLALAGKNRQAIRDLLQLAQFAEQSVEEKAPIFTPDRRDDSVIGELIKAMRESESGEPSESSSSGSESESGEEEL